MNLLQASNNFWQQAFPEKFQIQSDQLSITIDRTL